MLGKLVMRKEDPPGLSGRQPLGERYAAELAKLKAIPGEWFAMLEYGSKRGASSARSALARRTRGYEFTTRNTTVYARYVGGES